MATMRTPVVPETALMKSAQISKPGANFEIVEREIPKPGAGHVRIKVQACGVCHSDLLTKEGSWPGIQYPRVPGHEVAGKLIVVGAEPAPIEVTPIQLISGSRSIQGWSTGTPADSEDTLNFAALTGVRPMIETYPLEKAGEAYERLMSGKAQFRENDLLPAPAKCLIELDDRQ